MYLYFMCPFINIFLQIRLNKSLVDHASDQFIKGQAVHSIQFTFFLFHVTNSFT